MTFDEWLDTDEGRMACFAHPRKMCEIVWKAAKRDSMETESLAREPQQDESEGSEKSPRGAP
jgi:hypothetical protein